MSSEEEKSMDELKKELEFYKNQTQVLREKNRDLRNAMLLSDSQTTATEQPEETAQESLSDIRKIIADSKKQISEKLTRFKESIEDSNETSDESSTSDISSAPSTPKFSTQMDGKTSNTETSPQVTSSSASTTENEAILYQIDYLKKEVDRLEIFLEQSERVNSKLQQLLVANNIDISEITKAIDGASQTAISGTAVKRPETVIPESKPDVVSPTITQSSIKEEPKKEVKLDPSVQKIFDEFIRKVESGISNEEITMGILEFRETLMNYIPHSRVFYEMQIEYRKWKKGTSSIKDLKDAMKEWANTIASTL